MKTIILNSVTACILFFSSNNAVSGQANDDSLRIVSAALQMIYFPEPEFKEAFVSNPGPKELADLGFEQPNQSETVNFEMRDGVNINGNKYAFQSETTTILLHGVLGSSFTFNKMAGLLREKLQSEVIAINLRGHGQSGGVPGDISTVNQYAQDLDDIITSVKNENPGQRIILAGHSMGGGIVLRHAETFPETEVEAYLLFAPNLGNNAPTTSQNLDLENNFIKTHIPRGLGLRLLNEYGIHQYDSLNVVFYNLPEQMPVRTYTYRSMEASYPKNLRNTLRNIDKPLLVLVGSNDEAFIPKEYPAVINSYSDGECYIIEGETHNGIRHNQEAMNFVGNWAKKNNL